ncbi:hypothetical protein GCM10023220_71750 [Streptomyces ziwulingensis]|uniref:Uncharacterized protein n=1 Tax=Streptomyces ziwulingensis TaxID=1045501 RepID=A0ABP9D6A4_9ACTN
MISRQMVELIDVLGSQSCLNSVYDEYLLELFSQRYQKSLRLPTVLYLRNILIKELSLS